MTVLLGLVRQVNVDLMEKPLTSSMRSVIEPKIKTEINPR